MAGFRTVFIKTTYHIGRYLSPDWLLKISRQKLIAPFYHIVSDEPPPHIRHLYPVKTVRQFERDLDFLLRHYQSLDLPAFQSFVLQNRQPDKPSCFLTFDDGLRQFHEVIAPILLRKGIPAACFLNSAFIDNQDLFYRYKASLLAEHFLQNPELVSDQKVSAMLAAPNQNAVSYLLSLSYREKQKLDDLASLTGYDFKEFLKVKKPYLTGEQIHELLKQGFHFGAHSVDHPEYRFLNFEEQIRQTKESLENICQHFGLSYKTFSFPFTDYGVSAQFFETIYRDQIADITFGCAGQKKELFDRHVQRISFEMAHLSAREIHNAELMYSFFRAFFGKNIIRRK